MKCIHCNNTYDKLEAYAIHDKDGNKIGQTCRFCGHRYIKKLKTEKPPERVMVDDEFG